MIILAIDTATADLIVGVAECDAEAGPSKTSINVLAESVVSTRAHAEHLVPSAAGVLSRAGMSFEKLDAVVVGCGPGPFTGLRVGMASASAFGQALNVPVHGVVTHDAAAVLAGGSRVLVVTDARRREVYSALYEKRQRVAGPEVCAPADLQSVFDGLSQAPLDVLSVPAHLADQVQQSLSVPVGEVRYIAPRTKGLIAAADLSRSPAPLVPHYLRRPDAQAPAPRPKSPAIPDVAR